MRPVVYFPELRIAGAFAPAYFASNVEWSERPSSDATATGAAFRFETVSTPRPLSRRPILNSLVINA